MIKDYAIVGIDMGSVRHVHDSICVNVTAEIASSIGFLSKQYDKACAENAKLRKENDVLSNINHTLHIERTIYAEALVTNDIYTPIGLQMKKSFRELGIEVPDQCDTAFFRSYAKQMAYRVIYKNKQVISDKTFPGLTQNAFANSNMQKAGCILKVLIPGILSDLKIKEKKD